MKKAAAAILISSAILVAAPSAVFADTGYNFCDYTSPDTSHGSAAPLSVDCEGGSITGSHTFYGVKVNLQSNALGGSTLYYRGYDLNASVPVGTCQSMTIPSGTGYQDILLPTPITFSSGQWPQINWYTNSSCTTNTGASVQFYYAPGCTSFSCVYKYFYTSIPDSSTRIEPTSPATKSETSTTTPGTTIDFSASYYYNSTSTPYGSYDSMVMYLNRVDAASSSITDFPGIQNDTYSSTSTTKTLPANSYWNLQWCFSQSAGTGLYACTPTQDIYVESNPLPNLFGTSTDNLTGLATSTCSITNVSGCVQNAVAFLFYPNQAVFDRFKTLQVNVQTHAPFGYVYTLIHQINNTSGAATPDFTLDIATSTQADLFTPIKNGIAAILWALAAFWFLKRIRDLHL